MQDDEKREQADEDWKKAVAEEKERLRREREASGEATDARSPLPEPDIRVFMAGLYTQTLICLGEMENPVTGERKENLPEAQYLIDTIGMLQQKTSGNLTPDEGAYVENILYDLRMRFVNATAKQGAAGGGKEAAQKQ